MATDPDVTERIKNFASEISSGPLGEVYHQPEDGARPLCCFQNVLTKVKKDGGDICFGWIFSHYSKPEHGGDYLVATHHAVWWLAGKLLDVTPFPTNQNRHPLITQKNYVLFLVDQSAQPVEVGNLVAMLPLKYFALSDNQKLREYVKEQEQQEQKIFQELCEKGKLGPHQISGYLLKPEL